MCLLDTGDGEAGEELSVGDLGVPLGHDAAQAGDRPVSGTRGVPGPGEARLGVGSDPTLHGHAAALISGDLQVTEGLGHNRRMLNPK